MSNIFFFVSSILMILSSKVVFLCPAHCCSSFPELAVQPLSYEHRYSKSIVAMPTPVQGNKLCTVSVVIYLHQQRHNAASYSSMKCSVFANPQQIIGFTAAAVNSNCPHLWITFFSLNPVSKLLLSSFFSPSSSHLLSIFPKIIFPLIPTTSSFLSYRVKPGHQAFKDLKVI